MERTKYLREALLSLTAGALIFNAGFALAIDYQIDKQGNVALCNFVSNT